MPGHPGRPDGRPMREAIGQMLPAAGGGAISPMPIVAVVLMLVSRRAVRTAGLRGRLDRRPGDRSARSSWRSPAAPARATRRAGDLGELLKLTLGVLFLLVGVRQWRGRPRDDSDASMPKWMSALDTFAPVKATGAGALRAG